MTSQECASPWQLQGKNSVQEEAPTEEVQKEAEPEEPPKKKSALELTRFTSNSKCNFCFFLSSGMTQDLLCDRTPDSGKKKKKKAKDVETEAADAESVDADDPEEDEDEDEAETEPKEMQWGGSRVRSRALVERSDCLQVLFDTSEIKRDFCSLNLCKPLVRSGPNESFFFQNV